MESKITQSKIYKENNSNNNNIIIKEDKIKDENKNKNKKLLWSTNNILKEWINIKLLYK